MKLLLFCALVCATVEFTAMEAIKKTFSKKTKKSDKKHTSKDKKSKKDKEKSSDKSVLGNEESVKKVELPQEANPTKDPGDRSLVRTNSELEIQSLVSKMGLFNAIKERNHESAKIFLLNITSEINDTENGKTPLFCAVETGQKDTLLLLLKRFQIDINKPDETTNDTPLIAAVKRENVDIVPLLLGRSDIQVNAKNLRGNTALHVAVGKKNEAMMSLLIAHPTIKFNIQNCLGSTPLHLAAERPNAILSLLLNVGTRIKNCLDATDFEGNTPLLKAIEAGNLANVKALIAAGCRCDVENKTLNTPLHMAVFVGDPDIFQLIFNKTAVLKKNNYGATPLTLALEHGRLELVKQFLIPLTLDTEPLEKMAPLQVDTSLYGDVTTTVPETAVLKGIAGPLELSEHSRRTDKYRGILGECLRVAARHNHEHIVKFLLSNNSIYPDEPDENGNTPCMLAAMHGHIAMVCYLLRTGQVSLTAQNDDGLSIFMHAVEQNQYELVKTLIELYSTKLQIKSCYPQKRTILMKAILNGRTDMAELLLSLDGLPINAQDVDGNTALIFASKQGLSLLVTQLLKYPCIDITLKNEAGEQAHIKDEEFPIRYTVNRIIQSLKEKLSI